MAGDIKVKVVADTRELDKELKKPRTFTGLLGFGAGGGKVAEAREKESKKTNNLLGNILKSVGLLGVVSTLLSGLIRLLKPFVELFAALSFLVFFPLWKALAPVLKGLGKIIGATAREGGGITGLIRGSAAVAEEGFEGVSISDRIAVAILAGIVGAFAIFLIAVTTAVGLIPALIIAAVAAVVTLIILAWDPLVTLFGIIVQGWKDFFKDMKEVWTITIDFFKGIGKKVANVWDTFIDNLKSGFNSTIDFFKNLPSLILDAMRSGFQIFVNGIKDIVNGVIGLINSVPGINIPRLANGGIVNKPTIALIGESGPEAIVPLSKGRGQGFGGGNFTFSPTINITGGGDDPREFARQVAQIAAEELSRRTGSLRF